MVKRVKIVALKMETVVHVIPTGFAIDAKIQGVSKDSHGVVRIIKVERFRNILNRESYHDIQDKKDVRKYKPTSLRMKSTFFKFRGKNDL